MLNSDMPDSYDNPIEDIEDIVLPSDITPTERQRNRTDVVLKPKRKKKRRDDVEPISDVLEPVYTDSVIPGTQKIWVKTWGCSHNNSDGEYMAGQLAAYGYTITEESLEADLWLLNSCTVKSPAEDHFRNEVKKGRELGKHVVVAGCVPQGAPKADYIQGLSVIGVQQIDRVLDVVEETLKGHSVRLLGPKKHSGRKAGGASLMLPKVRKNPLIEIIAINTGCLNQCTYCKTKHARGELGSYPPEDIVARAKQSFQEGVVEIWLTSEDLGAYGKDIGVTLPQLLWQLVDTIPEGAMLRLGMTNPPYILEHLEEMAKILSLPRVYCFLHVPVQSGSDSVLMDMKREYCEADFRHVMDFLKARVPNVNIATDVICGFPTETAEDFEKTMQLVRDYKFSSLFINQFFSRPGTPAAKMNKVPAQEIKSRTKDISTLFHAYTTYDHQVGQRQTVLVTETSHDGKYYVGHNKSYDQVLVSKDNLLLGKMVEVVITSASKHSMMSEVVKDREAKRPVSVPPPLAKGQVSGLTEEMQHTSKTDGDGQSSVWVHLTVIMVVFAGIIRLALFVFSDSNIPS